VRIRERLAGGGVKDDTVKENGSRLLGNGILGRKGAGNYEKKEYR